MRNFSQTKSTEFWSTSLVGFIYAILGILIKDNSSLGIGLTIISSTYLIGCGLTEKGRGVLVDKKGHKSAQFGVLLFSIVALAVSFFSKRIGMNTAIICASIIAGSYNLSRGFTKNFTPNLKVNNF